MGHAVIDQVGVRHDSDAQHTAPAGRVTGKGLLLKHGKDGEQPAAHRVGTLWASLLNVAERLVDLTGGSLGEPKPQS